MMMKGTKQYCIQLSLKKLATDIIAAQVKFWLARM